MSKECSIRMILIFFLCLSFLFTDTNQLTEPSFWIERCKEQGIFNNRQLLNKSETYSKCLMFPLNHGTKIPGRYSRSVITNDFAWFGTYKYLYTTNNKILNYSKFIKDMRYICSANRFPETIEIQFGVIISKVQVLAFPTNIIIMQKKDDPEFNVLNKSFLDIGDEVCVLHKSLDGKWGLIESKVIHGWILLENVAFAKRSIIKDYVFATNRVIVINKTGDIYENSNCSKKITSLVIGSTLPVVSNSILLPTRDKDGELVLKKVFTNNDFLGGYFPQTYSNLAIQTFKMLGSPYLWGGFDCSEYIRRVFLTLGIEFPRNSFQQVGKLKCIWKYTGKKINDSVLDKLTPFKTLIALDNPCHVMIYLGKINNDYYVIHNIWSTYIRNQERLIKKVTVTTLDLGIDGKGSLRSRIYKIASF